MLSPPARIATTHDELIRTLIPARPVTQSRLAPRRLRLTTDGRTPLSTDMWMVTWIHSRSSNRWTSPHMSRTSSLPDALVLVIYIAYLSNRCHAEDMHPALLTRWQTYQRIIAFFCHELSAHTCAPDHLTATTPRSLDVMNRRTSRDIRQGN